jgi:hypothetical protein
MTCAPSQEHFAPAGVGSHERDTRSGSQRTPHLRLVRTELPDA